MKKIVIEIESFGDDTKVTVSGIESLHEKPTAQHLIESDLFEEQLAGYMLETVSEFVTPEIVSTKPTIN